MEPDLFLAVGEVSCDLLCNHSVLWSVWPVEIYYTGLFHTFFSNSAAPVYYMYCSTMACRSPFHFRTTVTLYLHYAYLLRHRSLDSFACLLGGHASHYSPVLGIMCENTNGKWKRSLVSMFKI